MNIDKSTIDSLRKDIEEIHDMIIDFSGGEKGIRDVGGLEHAIYSIFNISSVEKKDLFILQQKFIIC